MDLLEALFGNFAFIIVLLWIIGSILGQLSKGKKGAHTKPEPQKRPVPEPSVEEQPDWHGEWLPIDPLDEEDEGRVPREEVPRIKVERDPGPGVSQRERQDGEDGLPRPMISKDSLTDQKVPSPSFTKLSKSPLVQGVIWQEVLGPPRGRRPHPLVRGKWK